MRTENGSLNNDNVNNDEPVYEELDRIITDDEILVAISNLKRSKSHGIDGLLDEYFIEYRDLLLPLLNKLFNGILISGLFPEAWSIAVMVPVFKRGDPSDPNNFRGISLVSCLAKLFTNIINNRLIEWSKTYDTITDAQFGFRQGLSTVDALFALQSVITKTLSNKNRLYCCFVDYTKAFDTIDRLNIWYKLSKIGICGKPLSVIKYMYENVKTCITVDGFYSDFFQNQVGLMQGEVIYPILFAIYVNDCEMEFLNNCCQPVELKELSLFLLMYADDMVIFSDTIKGLQDMLNTLYCHTEQWKLCANINKNQNCSF